jgi:hypothetical protein
MQRAPRRANNPTWTPTAPAPLIGAGTFATAVDLSPEAALARRETALTVPTAALVRGTVVVTVVSVQLVE